MTKISFCRGCTHGVEATQGAGCHKDLINLKIGAPTSKGARSCVKSMTSTNSQLIFTKIAPYFVLLRESSYRSESYSDFFVTISRKPAT
jgi:hypothetical protein